MPTDAEVIASARAMYESQALQHFLQNKPAPPWHEHARTMIAMADIALKAAEKVRCPSA